MKLWTTLLNKIDDLYGLILLVLCLGGLKCKHLLYYYKRALLPQKICMTAHVISTWTNIDPTFIGVHLMRISRACKMIEVNEKTYFIATRNNIFFLLTAIYILLWLYLIVFYGFSHKTLQVKVITMIIIYPVLDILMNF